MVTKQQIINFFKTKPVRLFLFFIVIAGIMTGVSFAIMALVRAMRPKCGKGQTTIEGQDGCFNESCVNQKCSVEGIGIDYSKGPECPCNTKCPEGFNAYSDKTTGVIDIKCGKECNGQQRDSDKEDCVYMRPQLISGKVKYTTIGFIHSDLINSGECSTTASDGTKVYCNSKSLCETIKVDGKIETYCKSNSPEPASSCATNTYVPCTDVTSTCTGGGNCVSGTSQFASKISVGYCETAGANSGTFCCSPELITLDSSGNPNCCDTGTIPVPNVVSNKKTAFNGCCDPSKVTNTGICCSPEQTLNTDKTDCCNSIIVIDGKNVCCEGTNLVSRKIYNGSSEINACTLTTANDITITGMEGVKNCKSQPNPDEYCFSQYKNINKKTDLDQGTGIYCDTKYNVCKWGCGQVDSSGEMPRNFRLSYSKDKKTASCITDVSLCPWSMDGGVAPSVEKDNNYILQYSTDTSEGFWKPDSSGNADKFTFNVTAGIPLKSRWPQGLSDSDIIKYCNADSCTKHINSNFSVTDITGEIASGVGTINPVCSGTAAGNTLIVPQCDPSYSTEHPGFVAPAINWSDTTRIPFSSYGVKPVPNYGVQWNGQNWILNSTSTTLNCNLASECSYLTSGLYCINGSYDGKNCISQEQISLQVANLCPILDTTRSYIDSVYCEMPNKTNNATSASYYCGTNKQNNGLISCVGNGLLTSYYNMSCLGGFTVDSQTKTCSTIPSSPLLEDNPVVYDQVDNINYWFDINEGGIINILGNSNNYQFNPDQNPPPTFTAVILLKTTISGVDYYVNSLTADEASAASSSSNVVPGNTLLLTDINSKLNIFWLFDNTSNTKVEDGTTLQNGTPGNVRTKLATWGTRGDAAGDNAYRSFVVGQDNKLATSDNGQTEGNSTFKEIVVVIYNNKAYLGSIHTSWTGGLTDSYWVENNGSYGDFYLAKLDSSKQLEFSVLWKQYYNVVSQSATADPFPTDAQSFDIELYAESLSTQTFGSNTTTQIINNQFGIGDPTSAGSRDSILSVIQQFNPGYSPASPASPSPASV